MSIASRTIASIMSMASPTVLTSGCRLAAIWCAAHLAGCDSIAISIRLSLPHVGAEPVTARNPEPRLRVVRERLFRLDVFIFGVREFRRSAAVPRARWYEFAVGLVPDHVQAPTTERTVVSSLASGLSHSRRDDGRFRLSRVREIRFRPFGHPPFLAFSRAALVLAAEERAPKSAPTLIGLPQCGQFNIRSTTGGPPSRRHCISGGPRRARASLVYQPR